MLAGREPASHNSTQGLRDSIRVCFILQVRLTGVLPVDHRHVDQVSDINWVGDDGGLKTNTANQLTPVMDARFDIKRDSPSPGRGVRVVKNVNHFSRVRHVQNQRLGGFTEPHDQLFPVSVRNCHRANVFDRDRDWPSYVFLSQVIPTQKVTCIRCGIVFVFLDVVHGVVSIRFHILLFLLLTA